MRHAIYLVLLSRCMDLTTVDPVDVNGITISTDSLLTQLKDQIPWTLPLVAAILHSLVAFFLLHWSRAEPRAVSPRRSLPLIAIITAALAIAVPGASMLCWNRLDLNGKTIVFYKKGFLNWMKPEWGDYGRLSQGMYGLLANSSLDMEANVGGTGVAISRSLRGQLNRFARSF